MNSLRLIRETEFNYVFERIKIVTKNLTVLEIGSGTGHQLALLNKIFKDSSGIDIDNKSFETLR